MVQAIKQIQYTRDVEQRRVLPTDTLVPGLLGMCSRGHFEQVRIRSMMSSYLCVIISAAFCGWNSDGRLAETPYWFWKMSFPWQVACRSSTAEWCRDDLVSFHVSAAAFCAVWYHGNTYC